MNLASFCFLNILIYEKLTTSCYVFKISVYLSCFTFFLRKLSLFVVVIGFVCCLFFTSIKRRYSLQLLFSLKTGTQKEKFKSPSYQIKVIAHNSMFSFCKDIMN